MQEANRSRPPGSLDVGEGYVERFPAPELTGLVRTVWVQQTGPRPYLHAICRLAGSNCIVRTQRFVLDHLAEHADGWVDRSWAIAHPHGTGRVYPNLPDPRLDHPGPAYHGENLARLITVRHHYDPARLFEFSPRHHQ